MRIVTTDDSTETLHCERYGEAYHSLNGAVREALEKFIIPCGIEGLARRGEVRILDVGFGLGYNVMAAVRAVEEAAPSARLRIVTLERDPVDVTLLRRLRVPEAYARQREIVLEVAARGGYAAGNLEIEMVQGDARGAIGGIEGTFQAVFHDPFSPRKNPELWTVQFFRALGRRMEEGAVLATYSAATPVRCGLLEAGFRIGPGPSDAMKRGGTLASRGAVLPPLTERELRRLTTSPERLPYLDDEAMGLPPGEILSRREALKERPP